MSTHHHLVPPVLPPANCFTVLVIDDMLPNRLLLSKFLKNAGYLIFEATNGIEALEMLREQTVQPDLIITDVEMPVMDGITLIEQVRHLDSAAATVPIITASGNADEQMKQQAVRAGTDAFMTKPFDLGALKREIAKQLKSRKRSIQRTAQHSPLVAPNRIPAESEVGLEK